MFIHLHQRFPNIGYTWAIDKIRIAFFFFNQGVQLSFHNARRPAYLLKKAARQQHRRTNNQRYHVTNKYYFIFHISLPVEGVVFMLTAPRSFLSFSSCSCCFLLWASAWWTGCQLKNGDMWGQRVWNRGKKERKVTQIHSPAVCGVCHIRVDSPCGRRRESSEQTIQYLLNLRYFKFKH